MLIVAERAKAGKFTVRDMPIRPTRQPFVNAARFLLDSGIDPGTPLVMRHAGSDTDCLRSTVGAAAKLTVQEGSFGGRPYFRPWVPDPRFGAPEDD